MRNAQHDMTPQGWRLLDTPGKMTLVAELIERFPAGEVRVSATSLLLVIDWRQTPSADLFKALAALAAKLPREAQPSQEAGAP